MKSQFLRKGIFSEPLKRRLAWRKSRQTAKEKERGGATNGHQAVALMNFDLYFGPWQDDKWSFAAIAEKVEKVLEDFPSEVFVNDNDPYIMPESERECDHYQDDEVEAQITFLREDSDYPEEKQQPDESDEAYELRLYAIACEHVAELHFFRRVDLRARILGGELAKTI